MPKHPIQRWLDTVQAGIQEKKSLGLANAWDRLLADVRHPDHLHSKHKQLSYPLCSPLSRATVCCRSSQKLPPRTPSRPLSLQRTTG